MKKIMKTLSLLLAVGAMAFGSGLHHEDTKVASAAENVFATLTFPNGNKKGVQNYTTTWTATIGTHSWSIVNANNNNNGWSYIRMGAKQKSGSASIANSTIFDAYITKIVVTVDKATYVTSSNLEYSTSSTFANSSKVDVSLKAGTITILPNSKTFGTGNFYKLNINYNNTSKDNGCIQISKVEYYADDSLGGDTGPTDEEKISAVEDAIDAIGTVEYSDSCKKSIDAARSVYNALDEALKDGVTNYATLTAAEARYEELKVEAEEAADKAAANAVITLLENLPEANEITDYSSASEVKAARDAYDKLTKDQMDLVPDQLVDKLEEVEAKLEQYAPAIETATFDFMVTSYPDYLDDFEMSESEISFKMIQGSSTTSISTNTYINPARFYAKYEVTLSSSDLVERISKVTITANNTSYAEVIKNANYSVSGTSISINGSVVTIEFNEDIKEFTFIPSAQTRVNKIEVEYNKYTVSQNTKVESITLDPSVLELTTGETAIINAEILPGNAADRTVTWSSTDATVASVEDGVVTALKEGTTTIKATANDGSGVVGTASVTVKDLIPNKYNATLITDAATIKAGDKIVIAAAGESVALGEEQANNNRKHVEVEKNGNNFGFVSGVEIITIEAGLTDGTFALKTDEGYLYAASSGSNHLKSQEKLDANGSFTIEIAEGIATIKATGSYTRNWIRYNSSDDLFSCYASGQADISIYKVEADYNLFVTDLLATNPCLKDAEVALELQERFECLKEEDKATFLSATVSEVDNTLLSERLDYIKTMANIVSNTEGLSSNLLSNITSSNNILIILVVGLLGLTSILGYYFLNKKRYAK